MPERKPSFFVVKVRALLPTEWLGSTGMLFRQAFTSIGAFLRVRERAQASPDLAWTALEGAATEKQSIALLNHAKRETEAIEAELKRRILPSKVRQEHAAAEKLESEARISQTKEVEARIELFEQLRELNVLPLWDNSGRMTVIAAPTDINWDELRIKLITEAVRTVGS